MKSNKQYAYVLLLGGALVAPSFLTVETDKLGAAVTGQAQAVLTPNVEEVLRATAKEAKAAPVVVARWERREARVSRIPFENDIERVLFAAADEFGITRDLALALMQQESGGDPNATSYVGAAGIAQVMPSTAVGIARELGLDHYDLYDPATSARFGMFYLAKQLKAESGNVERALRAYNAGPGAVDASYGYAETNNYARNILALQQHYYDVRVNLPRLDAIFESGYWKSGYGFDEANHNDAAGFWDNGIDIAPNDRNDTVIHAPMEGVVEAVYTTAENPVGGNAIVLRSPSGRYRLYFGHMENVRVVPGQTVAFGQDLGDYGMTGAASGPHIHLSMKVSYDGGRTWQNWKP